MNHPRVFLTVLNWNGLEDAGENRETNPSWV